MAGPFDDQLVLDMLEDVVLGTLGGSSSTIASCSVDEVGVQPVQAGLLSLVGRDYQITMGRTQCPTRPVEGAAVTLEDGTVATIFSVLWRKLGNYWEVGARSFSVPGGLTESITLSRRDSSDVAATGLNDPEWSQLESGTAGSIIPDDQGMDLESETAADTKIHGLLALAGYREMRAGDIVSNDGGTTLWTVESMQPYTASLGVQFARVTRIV